MSLNDEFEDECEKKEVCGYDVEISEKMKTDKSSLLKQCDKINDLNNINFISDIRFGSDDEKMSEKCYHIIERYRPTMKMVFRHKTFIEPELVFDINMIKSKPNVNLVDLDSIETVNKPFTFGNLNNICIKRTSTPFNKRKYKDLQLRSECDEKYKPNKYTLFEVGRSSLDYDNTGCDYSSFYNETINIIYSSLKQYFMDLCTKIPSYDSEYYPSHNSNTKTKVVGLLYSGGKDSTCRLLELLEQGECVVPIVNTLNSHNSTELLIRDIATVYNLSKIYKTKRYKGTLYRPKFLTYLSWHFDSDHIGLSQQPYNVMSLTTLGYTFLNNCKRIECCLIDGDIGISYISEMKKLYKTAMKFNYNVVNGGVKSIPPLVFPYTKIIKDSIIYSLEKRFENITDDVVFNTLIPTCQDITIRSIKIVFSLKEYWLYVSLENCGNCLYCKTYNNKHYYTLCIPLVEAKSIEKDDIILSRDQLCSINSKFSNIFTAY